MAEAAICLAFLLFVLARAIRVPLTYDEAATYLRYIAPHTLPEFDAGPLAVFNFEVATNHFLSTVLAKLSTLVAGSSEVALRAPALLGYGLYLWFSARILRQLTTGTIAVGGLLLLNVNPYLLDFFALSRGYGLSIGLMMAALHFFFTGRLGRTLFCASAAVLAAFSMLTVYLGFVALAVAGLQQVHVKLDTTGSARRRVIALSVVAAVFAAAVFSQDPGLSPALYQPVTVRVDGLNPTELHTVTVSRIDLRGRVTTVPHVGEAEDAWHAAGGAFRLLRVDMAAAAADHLARLDIIVGNREFATDPRQPAVWIRRTAGSATQFESRESLSNPRSGTQEFRAVMNWAGDRQYAIAIARATAIALAALAALAVLLAAAGTLAARLRLVPEGVWRIASRSVLWVAALVGPPLYILRRDAQLYFGGTRGLVQDTFNSVIENSLYGRAHDTRIAFAIIAATIAAFALFWLAVRGANQSRALGAAAQLLALVAFVSVSLVVQRALFGTVYLVGRTALFFIPLYLLFLVLFCQSLIEAGRLGKMVGASVLLTALALAAFHFARTANVQYALDWRDDAGTKAMMADVERGVATEGPRGRTAMLGAEWIYAPAAVYYARRHDPVDVEVTVAPFSRPVDFVYVAERHAGAAARVVGTYPIAGTVLARSN